jgi:hypothetical protein
VKGPRAGPLSFDESLRRIRYVMLSTPGENCGELWIPAPFIMSIVLLRTTLDGFFHVAGPAEMLGVALRFPHPSKQKPALPRQPDIGSTRSLEVSPDGQLGPSPASEPQREGCLRA